MNNCFKGSQYQKAENRGARGEMASAGQWALVQGRNGTVPKAGGKEGTGRTLKGQPGSVCSLDAACGGRA